MSKVCEEVVNLFSFLFFKGNWYPKNKENEKIEYTLSSVFPTKAIMEEVRRYL